MIDVDAAARAVLRSNIYATLALAFSTPKGNAEVLYEAIKEEHAIITQTGKGSDKDSNKEQLSLDALKREHLRLFVGPGHVQCPPYESVYRRDRPEMERGLLMGATVADVRRRYGEANLKLSTSFTDLPDHIAIEMEFMHFLCAEESRLAKQGDARELETNRKMQREFLSRHLKPWVEIFSDCVRHSTESPFYQAAANLVKVFLEGEFEDLPEEK